MRFLNIENNVLQRESGEQLLEVLRSRTRPTGNRVLERVTFEGGNVFSNEIISDINTELNKRATF